jgi:uncharacterized phiE125 gp8 family phage protein
MEVLPPAVAPVAVAEAKAFLRLDGSAEDALIAGFIRAATGLAEAFTGQALIVRDIVESASVVPTWQRLKTAPCVAITGIDGLIGPAFETDIDLAGNGWVRVIDPGAATRVTVRYRAGLAADWNGVPEPLRLGIVRLVSHFHAHRDAPDAGGPPAAVAALWRPFRRLRLG